MSKNKIPLEEIKDEVKQKVTFFKRSSLYKNPSKIVRDCNIDIGIVSSCPIGRNQYSYVHSITDVVIGWFVNPIMELDLGTRLVA